MNKFLAILLLLLSTKAMATDGDFGFGLIVGEPIGISANYKFAPYRSVDAALSYNFENNDRYYIHSTYLFLHPKTIMDESNMNMGWYSGIGARFKYHDNRNNDDHYRLGARAVIGSSMNLRPFPVEFFLELAPVLDVAPSTELDLTAALGFRYYF